MRKRFFTCLALALLLTSCGEATEDLASHSPPTVALADLADASLPCKPIAPPSLGYIVYEDIAEAKRVLSDTVASIDALIEYHYDQTAFAALHTLCADTLAASENADALVISEMIHEVEEAINALPLAQGALPRVYLTYDEATLNRNSYIPLSVLIVDATDGTIAPQFVEDATIVIRGNSTSSAPKKPFNIKLPSKASVLGLDSGKKWCLLSECYEKTMMRNYIAFHLGHAFGMEDTPTCRYVDVFANGAYQGVYLLTTPVSDGRLDLDKKESAYLFETEASRVEANTQYYKTAGYGVRFEMKYPERLTSSQKKELDTFFEGFEGALTARDFAKLSQYIDVESFVNSFILHELMKPVDFTYSSVNYTMTDGILRAGPIWDFDLSSGNVSTAASYDTYKRYNNLAGFGGDDSGDSTHGFWAVGHWYDMLKQIPDFMELVKARFSELQPQIINLYSDNELGKSLVSELLDTYGTSFEANYAECGWVLGTPYSYYERTYPNATLEGNVEYLRSWLERRNAWLCEQWIP